MQMWLFMAGKHEKHMLGKKKFSGLVGRIYRKKESLVAKKACEAII